MTLTLENNTFDWNLSDSVYELGATLRFWLFLIVDVPSVFCIIFVLYHLLIEKTLRQALHNHTTIVLLSFGLVYGLIDIPMHLQFFWSGIVRPGTSTLCLFWWFIDWGFFYNNSVLLTWASMERHILTFHMGMLGTRRKRLLVHYIPLISIVIFMMTFYSVAIFGTFCENTFDYTMDLCGLYACYASIPFFLIFEQVIFSVVCNALTALFCMALVVRVIRQKYRIHRSVQWRKQRKLCVQMIAKSSLYLIFSFPLTLIYVVRLSGASNWGNNVLPVFFFLSYYAILLLPFVCLNSLPKLKEKVKELILRRRGRQVAASKWTL